MLGFSTLRSLLSALALVMLVAGVLALSTRSMRIPGGAPAPLPEDPRPDSGDGFLPDPANGDGGEGGGGVLVLERRDVCIGAGFLCAEVAEAGELRLFRWPSETRGLRIYVPQPSGLPLSRAQALQRAAVRGIRAWQGHPFPLTVTTRRDEEDQEVSVEWRRKVADGRLGLTRVGWTGTAVRGEFRVVEFALATHHPMDTLVDLTPEQVELVASHEMGHALGLPHSDDPRDVMFPENTAGRLSTEDFRTLQALYSLPNGAVIR